ncbi:MAG TPA: peptidyl-tRNA hydrolase [Pseudonocardiaceae bacterium]|nr:peptidyl-tRNA hydrolase [Pseudonocardiaceae bacterium]
MSGDATCDSHSHSQLLAPLAARYASWLGLPVGADSAEEDPESVRAMPLILRLERDSAPPRSALLEAAASAAVALCLDERALPGGPWHPEVVPWIAGRIRKVTRRARGAHWAAVADLPGITIERHGAEVRALVPWLVADMPRTVTRLQVGGTDVPPDDPGPPEHGLPVLWLRPELIMTVGKAAAQVGHATMLLAALLAAEGWAGRLSRWAAHGYRCAVRTASAKQWAALAADERPDRAWRERQVLAVRDAGFTEVPPGTITVAAQFAPI